MPGWWCIGGGLPYLCSLFTTRPPFHPPAELEDRPGSGENIVSAALPLPCLLPLRLPPLYLAASPLPHA